MAHILWLLFSPVLIIATRIDIGGIIDEGRAQTAEPQWGPIIFWWETEHTETISEFTSKIMHAALKSVYLHFKDPEVIVYSNSLPADYFCGGSSLSGLERRRALNWTCRASVRPYDVRDFLKDAPTVRDEIVSIYENLTSAEDPMGSMHLVSDIMRYLMLHTHGGTYMDFDQIFIRPLPKKAPLVAGNYAWEQQDCDPFLDPATNKPDADSGAPWWCMLPYSTKGGQEWPNPDIRVFLFSGVIAGLKPKSDLMELAISMIPESYTPGCWGCLGPELLTHVIDLCGSCVYIMQPQELLIEEPIWATRSYSYDVWSSLPGAILDVDFHTDKTLDSVSVGLVERTLLAKWELWRTRWDRDSDPFDSVLDQRACDFLEALGNSEASVVYSEGFASLPWLDPEADETSEDSAGGDHWAATGCGAKRPLLKPDDHDHTAGGSQVPDVVTTGAPHLRLDREKQRHHDLRHTDLLQKKSIDHGHEKNPQATKWQPPAAVPHKRS